MVVCSNESPEKVLICLMYLLKKIKKFLFLERGEGREKERERNIEVKEKH